MSKVNFISGTQALYDAIATKDADSLYFISDTQRVYKGDVDVTQNVFPVTNFPSVGVDNKIYINTNTLETKVFSNGEFSTLVPGYATTLDTMKDEANAGKLATIGAIKEYIAEVLAKLASDAFQKVEFDAETGTLNFEGSQEGTTLDSAQLEGVAHDAEFDAANLKITIPQYGKEDLVINIPKDQFLKNAYYDKEYHFEDGTTGPAIVFVVETAEETEKEIAVPAGDMTNDYTATSTNSIELTISADHDIKATFKAQKKDERGFEDGVLTVYNQARGMNYMTGVKIQETGELEDSDNKVPVASIVVAAIKTAVEELKGHILDDGNPDEVVISTTDGIIRSGVVIGKEVLANNPNAQTLATEAAVYDAVSWKTLA